MLKKIIIISGCLILAGLAGIILAMIIPHNHKTQEVMLPILMYHAITKEGENVWCVSLEDFIKQMEFLHQNNYTTVLPSDIISFLKHGKPLPKKPIMLTFDDGYLFNLTLVEPILAKYGFKGVIYLITSLTGKKENERKSYKQGDCLVWPEILAMQKRGTFVFGGHSHEHVNLAVADDYEEQIKKCKEELKKHNVKEPLTFCYPGGQYNEKVINALRSSGFVMAVACKDEIAKIGKDTDLYSLPRISMIGGKHSFKLIGGSLENEKVICKILHNGITIPISAKLYIKGLAPLLLPARDVPDGVFELEFILPIENISVEQLEKLELWDKHNLFLLETLTK